MENSLVQWLMNWAFDHGISVTFTSEVRKDLPHCAIAEKRSVLINMNYGDHDQIPFALAHEIGHVMDNDLGVRYYSSATLHSKAEYRANLFGIHLLKEYCVAHDVKIDNPVKFCELFGVPMQLDYIAWLAINETCKM